MPASPDIQILIVDDNESTRLLLRNILAHAHFKNVVEAENGGQAWEFLKENSFDLVITDWHMQEMSGLKLLQKIRNTAKTQEIPVIMITIHAEKKFVNKALQAGVTNYITKPFDREIVIKKLHMVFDRPSL